MNRRKSREVAMRILFSMTLSGNDITSAIENFKKAEFEDIEQVDFEYVEMILKGVQEHKEEIDKNIQDKLHNWKINRLSNTSLAIMRIAAFEIEHVEDVPARVAVNEAIELGKIYCEDKATDLINGVLHNFV
ncbi:transcription antitermination factor NusB [Oceanirhabdus sp. W0125-5]|uniref:transcription antitermination factor NusB n=1 Tax=Oceanirhabdus sp. W0125-5 TaxID=2999116 RepID=UPI0022F3467E|nr:transcription antitermination factor NusB [Oceanirhabdus sp. W0125-5]WBW95326.1 transcription antitermination factor NusB [Oceanirhabdus sp. W0125-5]